MKPSRDPWVCVVRFRFKLLFDTSRRSGTCKLPEKSPVQFMATRDIVAVGASLGGVEALRVLLGGIPADFPASIMVVLHRMPNRPSYLEQVLSGCKLKVTAAHDRELVRRGWVYIAPPDRHLILERGKIRVTFGPKENLHRPSIDVLFRSAAQSYGPQVIGVVLTGSLSDGAAGLAAIKA